MKLNALQEFLVVALILATAVLLGWNINLSGCNKRSSQKSTAEKTAVTNTAASPEQKRWQEGKSLFKSNCAACHNPKADGTGPVLIGVKQRWQRAGRYQEKEGSQWLYSWIKNWNEPVAAGYNYAIEMANTRPSQMNVFTTLKDEDIDKILLYAENPDGLAPSPDVK